MSRRHADIWSHFGHNLVDLCTWPWSPNGQDHIWPWKFKYQGHGQSQTHCHIWGLEFKSICLLFVSWQSDHFWLRYSRFHIWPWKIQDQGHGQGKIWWSHLRSRVQLMCLLFVSWQSDHFWQRYSQFHIWPWKFKVKVIAKVKLDGHIWYLEINGYVCFSFRGNCTVFGWDIANSIFDLENSRSRWWPRSNPMVTFEA